MEKTDSWVKHSSELWTLAADWQETAFRRRMTVMKLATGGLLVHSAVDLRAEQWAELQSFGPVEGILVPNFFHDSEAPVYAHRFPGAKLFAPESCQKKMMKACLDRPIFKLEEDWEGSTWANEVVCIPIQGLRLVAEAVFLHRGSRTLVMCDMAFNMREEQFQGLERRMMRWNRVGQGFGPSRLATSFFVKDSKKAALSFQKIANLDFDRVIVNHGDILETDGKAEYLRAFSKFL